MLLTGSGHAILAHTSLKCWSLGFSKSSTSSSFSRRNTRQQTCIHIPGQHYATSVGQQDENEEDCRSHAIDPNDWPQPLVGQQSPTPYQILETKRKDIYTKARFYELVKFYHPDRHGNSADRDQLPQAIRVERYRLIVAAHSILSDPVKRTAYDRFGSGWNGKPGVHDRHDWQQRSSNQRPGPFSQSWDQPADPIWQNATWEDWERFYARRDRDEGKSQASNRRQQAPVHFQNTYFLALVIMLIMLGSSGNYKRAQDHGKQFVERRDDVHDRTAKDLRRVRQEMMDIQSRDKRIDWFVRSREATMSVPGSDIDAIREEKAGRLLPQREVCRSEEVATKDV